MNAVAKLAQISAVAIVTGRKIEDIDRFLSPLQLPVAGVHGLERRSAEGTVHVVPINEHALRNVSERLTQFVMGHPGLILEPKRGSIALHYRQRSELANACLREVTRLTVSYPDLRVLPGKMVLEIKAGLASKGSAIRAFLQEEPFLGKIPFFVGDDVTDEEAFPVVRQAGGLTVRIGSGTTAAMYRASDPEEFAEWLAVLTQSFSLN